MRVETFAALVLGWSGLAAGCGGWADDLTCARQGCDWTPGSWQRLRTLSRAALPPLPPDPTNRWADDAGAARLGQRFFFDPDFSGTSRQTDALRRPTAWARAPLGAPVRVSCASCHDPLRGGTDAGSAPGNVSVGAGLTDVNALPTLNAARRKTLFWNGRLDSGWGLNALVGESDITMNGSRLQTAHVLADRYQEAVQAVFGDELPADWPAQIRPLPAQGKPGFGGCRGGDPGEPEQDAFDCLATAQQELVTRLFVFWAKALAAYGRLLESGDSPFDRFVASGPASGAISPAARRGARLFVGKASCIDCHSGPLLTDEDFHNIGVPQTGPGVPTVADCQAGSVCDCADRGRDCLPWGRFNGLAWQREKTGAGWYQLLARYRDGGPVPMAAEMPADESLKGAWRTPSLRDVALTAPYMHDGAYRTLPEVVQHYNSGGRLVTGAVGRPAVKLQPLALVAGEVDDLVAFLEALTGEPPPAALREPPAP